MNPLHPTWQQTLPFCLAPREEEWLPAYLLRCDEVNHWTVGTTARLVLASAGGRRGPSELHGIATPHLDMEAVAQFTGVARDAIESLTYQADLHRIYQTASPRATWLGGQPQFRVCPACLRQWGTLMRWTTLPRIAYCPVHGIRYQAHCLCGRQLRPFSPGEDAFTCPSCGQRWDQLPQEHGETTVLERERHLTRFCQWILTTGSRSFLSDAMNFLQGFVYGSAQLRNGRHEPIRQFLRHYRRKMVVIGLLGVHLASLEMSIETIQDHILHHTWKSDPTMRRFWRSMPGTDDDSYWLGSEEELPSEC